MKTALFAAAAALAVALPTLASAATLTYYDPSHSSNEPAFKTVTVGSADIAAPVAAASQGQTRTFTYYDPSHSSNDPAFKTVVVPVASNASAAAADAARYAAAGDNAATGAVLGTHDAGVSAPKLIRSYDPAADTNQSIFSTRVVIANPANAAAAAADAASYR